MFCGKVGPRREGSEGGQRAFAHPKRPRGAQGRNTAEGPRLLLGGHTAAARLAGGGQRNSRSTPHIAERVLPFPLRRRCPVKTVPFPLVPKRCVCPLQTKSEPQLRPEAKGGSEAAPKRSWKRTNWPCWLEGEPDPASWLTGLGSRWKAEASLPHGSARAGQGAGGSQSGESPWGTLRQGRQAGPAERGRGKPACGRGALAGTAEAGAWRRGLRRGKAEAATEGTGSAQAARGTADLGTFRQPHAAGSLVPRQGKGGGVDGAAEGGLSPV